MKSWSCQQMQEFSLLNTSKQSKAKGTKDSQRTKDAQFMLGKVPRTCPRTETACEENHTRMSDLWRYVKPLRLHRDLRLIAKEAEKAFCLGGIGWLRGDSDRHHEPMKYFTQQVVEEEHALGFLSNVHVLENPNILLTLVFASASSIDIGLFQSVLKRICLTIKKQHP